MSAIVQTHRRNPTRWWLIGLLVLFGVMALRVHAIQFTYMRDDEEIAFRTTENHEVGYTIWYQAMQDVHTPTWFVSFWLWQQVFGSTEFMARVYSIFLSLITLSLVYQIGRQWFGAARFGVFALTILGVNAFAFIYSLEIRPYAMVMLAAALNMGLFRRWLDRPSGRRAALYGASVALLMWIHYFTAFLVMAEIAYLLLSRRLNAKLLRQALGAALVAFLLWCPYLPFFIGQVQALKRVESSTGAFRGLGIGSTTEVTSLKAVIGLVTVVTNGLPLLYGAILLLGLILLLRRKNYWLALAWLALVPVANFAVNLIASVYTQRYLSYISLGLALAAGAALAALPRYVRWVALIAVAAVSLWTLPAQLPVRTPYREIFRTIDAYAQPGDVIVFDKGNAQDNFVKWQISHYLTPALQQAVVSPDDLADQRRIWYVTAHWFDPDVQSTFHAIEQMRPLQRVIGNCDLRWCYLAQLLQGPFQKTPTLFGDRMAFWGADVESISPSRVDVRLWWKVAQAPDKDYSIGVQVLDGSGKLVAQADGPLQLGNGSVVQTSQMVPDKIYIDPRALVPSVPLPTGTYTLVLVVYQSWDNVRLKLPDGSDSLQIGMIAVP